MDAQRLAAYLLIGGAGLMVVSFVIGLSGIYQIEDLEERVQIIQQNNTRWVVSQTLTSLSVLITAAGFAVLAYRFGQEGISLVPVAGAAAMVVGAISAVIFIYRQTTEPLATYGGAYGAFETLYYWLAIAGLLLFGMAFLQTELPSWLGFVTAGASLIYGIFFFVSGIGFPTPGLVFFLSLLIAIMLLRQ